MDGVVHRGDGKRDGMEGGRWWWEMEREMGAVRGHGYKESFHVLISLLRNYTR